MVKADALNPAPMETDDKEEFYFKTGTHSNFDQTFDRCVLEQTRKRNKTVKA